jgi:hypothetical protein
VGTRIWELIAERGLLRDVASSIVAEFEVDSERAELDLLKLVRALLEKQLVEIEGAPPTV